MKRTALLLAAAATLSLGAVAHAQDPSAPDSNPPPSTATQPVNTPDPSAPPADTAPTDAAPDTSPAPPATADSAGQPSASTESSWLGATVVDSHGKAVGKINRLIKSEDGAVTGAQLRVRGKTVVAPIATLTLGDDGKAVSSQTLTQIETETPEAQ